MNKILVICGPTATGKTKLGIEIAQKLNGEIISADSRQVFVGKNLIYGKDLPPNAKYQISNIKWRDRKLKFYEIDGIRIWLYDVVEEGESFNVSFWRECADLVIADILDRKKMPIIVGGTGLYLKSLTQNLSDINIPYDQDLRKKLENKNASELFDYLKSINLSKAESLNNSDRHNPRRLIRVIEVSSASPSLKLREGLGVSYLQIGLTASKDFLYHQVDQRIFDRMRDGAAKEDPGLSLDSWENLEHSIVRHQLTWFKKQPNIQWFDISSGDVFKLAYKSIQAWYNKS